MSSYVFFLSLIGIVQVSMCYILEKLRIGPLWLFFGAWFIPVFLSQNTHLIFNREWSYETFMATQFVTVGFLLGYFVTFLVTLNVNFNSASYLKSTALSRLRFCTYMTAIVVIISYTYLYFKIGGPPLTSGGVGVKRILLTKIAPPVFSLAQLANLFAVSYGLLRLQKNNSQSLDAIWILILLLLILSGWRNLILTYLVFTLTPIICEKRPRLSKVFLFVFCFLIIFSIIGFIRGDQGDRAAFDYGSAADLILLYIYPAFINFEILQSFEVSGSHYFTLQFLFKPIYSAFDMNVIPPQNAIGAFNVATGLTPLYHDGGTVNIFCVFLFLGILLRILLKVKNKGVIVYFAISSIFATIIFLHNGWFLLNYMFSYNLIAYVAFSLLYFVVLKPSKVGKFHG